MAEMSDSDPQFEIYKKRFFEEVKRGNLVMIKALAKKNPQLLNSLHEKRWTVLHVAASWRKLNVVEWVLSDEGRAAGFNSILSKAEGNVTALDVALYNGNLECFKAIVYGCKVENGEREQMLNAVNEGGLTVLHIAAMEGGKFSIIQWLLSDEKGGGREAGFKSLFATSKDNGLTALHLSAGGKGDWECFEVMVYGCKVGNGEREQMLNAVDDHGRTVLHVAAAMGNTSIIQWLLSDKKGGGREAGFGSVSTTSGRRLTALHFAAQGGNLEGFIAIVEGCKEENGEREKMLNAADEQGYTVLHYAVSEGNTSIVKWLLSDEKGGGREAGFHNVLAKESRRGCTVLHLVSEKKDLECFVAIVEGCKVENGEREKILNAVNDLGFTVLHYAAMEGGKVSIIQWLLSDEKGGGREAGFDSVLAAEKENGKTALHVAAERGNLECFVAIVEGCKVENGEREKMLNVPCYHGSTVLHIAARHNYPSIIKWLLSKGRDHGFTSILAKDNARATALHIAAHQGHLEACKAIVEGCKAREREETLNEPADDEGYTALHFAAVFRHTSIVSWLLSDKPGGGRTLGFNCLLTRNRYGESALHLAAEAGELEACKAIVEGCKVENGEREQMLNAADDHDCTVLHLAARSDCPDMVAWLLSRDADGGRANGLKTETITAATKEPQSALHFAAQSGSVDTVRALLSGCTVGERLKLFLAVDDNGWTALHEAARCCQPGIIRELLLHHEETKMIVNHRDHRGMTVLHQAVLDIDPDAENRAPREEVVAALLTNEYDDDDEEEEGRKGQAASSSKKGSKQQQQQAAFIDVNLGLKIE